MTYAADQGGLAIAPIQGHHGDQPGDEGADEPASAHQIWIEQPDGQTAVIRFGEFGENLREASPGLLGKFVKPAGTLVSAKGERSSGAARTATGFTLPFKAGESGRVSMSPQCMLFGGATGRLPETREGVGAAAETRGVLYALHLGRFSDGVTRWFYFLVSLMGTAMVGTGLVMWTVKRRRKLPDPERPHIGFRIVERLNIADIAGLSVAMTAYLWGNRLLPAGIAAAVPKRR